MGLDWKDEYLLGIPALDLQHKRIFECLAGIAPEGAAPKDRGLADSSFAQLLRLLQQHSALEESMMRSFNYPELEPHIEEHRQFHAAVHDPAQESLRTKASVPLEVIKGLHEWQRKHILTSDRHYMEYFLDPSHNRGGSTPVTS